LMRESKKIKRYQDWKKKRIDEYKRTRIRARVNQQTGGRHKLTKRRAGKPRGDEREKKENQQSDKSNGPDFSLPTDSLSFSAVCLEIKSLTRNGNKSQNLEYLLCSTNKGKFVVCLSLCG
jgi:hypothetical protein